MKERIIWGAIALAIFLPFLYFGGLPFQLLIGILAMIGVSEMLKMRRLEIFSFEGVLAMLAAFVLTVPLDNYLGFLPVDASFSAYSILVLLILAGTVLNSSRYSFEEAAFPIAASLYVGIGFQNLINARIAGFDKVLLALFIVWATDSGAYFIGRRFGQHKLLPAVSPNKTIEGSLGGILSAVPKGTKAEQVWDYVPCWEIDFEDTGYRFQTPLTELEVVCYDGYAWLIVCKADFSETVRKALPQACSVDEFYKR